MTNQKTPVQGGATEEQIEAAARTLNLNGWTCDGGADEPGNYDECEDCRRACRGLAGAMLRSALSVSASSVSVDEERIEWPEHWSKADRLSDLHARYHGQTGNLLASDECGWERCDFWGAAEMTMDAVAEAALSVSASADPADEHHESKERRTPYASRSTPWWAESEDQGENAIEGFRVEIELHKPSEVCECDGVHDDGGCRESRTYCDFCSELWPCLVDRIVNRLENGKPESDDPHLRDKRVVPAATTPDDQRDVLTTEHVRQTFAYVQAGLDDDDGYPLVTHIHVEAFNKWLAGVKREAASAETAALGDREKLIAELKKALELVVEDGQGYYSREIFVNTNVVRGVVAALAAPVEVDEAKLTEAIADELETDGRIAEEWSAGKIAATARRIVEHAVKPILRGEGR